MIMKMANLEIKSKTTFTVWYYLLRCLLFFGINPNFLSGKTLANIKIGNKTAEVKFNEIC